MRLTALGLIVVFLVTATSAIAQSVDETIDVQGWKVHLETNADGSATCAAMWTFDDDSAVGFAADTNKNTFLIVSEPEVELVKNRKYEVKYGIDGGKTKRVMAVATSKVMLVVPISDPDAEFAAFGRAQAINVEFGGEAYEEPLQKARGAIQALGRCVVGAP